MPKGITVGHTIAISSHGHYPLQESLNRLDLKLLYNMQILTGRNGGVFQVKALTHFLNEGVIPVLTCTFIGKFRCCPRQPAKQPIQFTVTDHALRVAVCSNLAKKADQVESREGSP